MISAILLVSIARRNAHIPPSSASLDSVSDVGVSTNRQYSESIGKM